MIIWRGRGIFIALIAFVCLILVELGTEAIFRDDTYYQEYGWPRLVGFGVAAALVYLLRGWFGVGQERTLIDKETSQEVQVDMESSLLFVPARYWPFILLILGVVFTFV
jgi:hypothetical protein